MNTWSLLSLSLLGGVSLISLLVFAWCAKRAPDGHEDAEGFHSKEIYNDTCTDRREVSPSDIVDHPISSASL